MSSIPLYIDLPLAPSLSKTLQLLEKDGYFSVHLVPFDADILLLMIATRPCAAIFSITDEESYHRVFETLGLFKRFQNAKQLPLREPALRMVLVAEHWAVQLERWMEVNVHEFVAAPILQKALLFKLNRHYAKALAAPLEGDRPCDPYAASSEAILVKEAPANPMPDMQAFCIPGENPLEEQAEPQFETFVIRAASAMLGDGREIWAPTSESSGFEETWTCVLPGLNPRTSRPARALVFTGDCPTYDTEKKAWVFRGEAPRLILRHLDQTRNEELLISLSNDRRKILVRNPRDYSGLKVTKRYGARLARSKRKMRIYTESGFKDESELPVSFSRKAPVPETADGAEVKEIADFLEKWSPRSGAANLSTTGAAEEKNSAHDRHRGPSSEKPLPGHYSGPGFRENPAPLNIDLESEPATGKKAYGSRQAAEASPSGPEAPKEPVKTLENDLAKDKTPPLRVRLAGQAAEKETPKAARSAEDSAPPDLRDDAGAPSEPSPAEPEKAYNQAESEAPKAASKLYELNTSASLPGKSMAMPAASSAEESAAYKTSDLKEASESGRPASDLTLSADSAAKPDVETKPHGSPKSRKGPSKKFGAKTVSKELQARIKGRALEEEQKKRFGHDTPDGAFTLSMQNEDAGATGKRRKIPKPESAEAKTDESPDAKSAPRSRADKNAPTSERALTPGPVPPASSAPAPTERAPSSPSDALPAPIASGGSLIERLRRFLARLFS